MWLTRYWNTNAWLLLMLILRRCCWANFILYLFSVHHVQKIQLTKKFNKMNWKKNSVAWISFEKINQQFSKFIFIILTKPIRVIWKWNAWNSESVLMETHTLRLSREREKKINGLTFQSIVVHRFQACNTHFDSIKSVGRVCRWANKIESTLFKRIVRFVHFKYRFKNGFANQPAPLQRQTDGKGREEERGKESTNITVICLHCSFPRNNKSIFPSILLTSTTR